MDQLSVSTLGIFGRINYFAQSCNLHFPVLFRKSAKDQKELDFSIESLGDFYAVLLASAERAWGQSFHEIQ
jgi:hypothetical protein